MKILIVEDSTAADELARMLIDLGHEVMLRDNLADAEYDILGIDETPTHEFDVLLLDYMMEIGYLPEHLCQKAIDNDEAGGWVFYYDLVKKDTHLFNNTIFYTTLLDSLRDVSEAYDIKYKSLKILPKHFDGLLIDEMERLLTLCKPRPKGD